jgi:hypothetical protein
MSELEIITLSLSLILGLGVAQMLSALLEPGQLRMRGRIGRRDAVQSRR